MIQLAFQPAYDPYHAAFRFFLLREFLNPETTIERYRIVDFYVCFPARLGGVRLAQSHSKFRRAIREFGARGSYEEQPSDALVFARMKPVQEAALHTLALEGFIEEAAFISDRVEPTGKSVSADLGARISASKLRNPALFEIASAFITEYEMAGMNGLKARTGLLEHRYDAV